MNKIRTIVLGVALALPMAVVGAVGEGTEKATTAQEFQPQSSSSYKCCWVFINGRWYCIACD